MVEGAALEMLFRGNFNEGSNPSLSVIRLDQKVEVAFCVGSTFFLQQFAFKPTTNNSIKPFAGLRPATLVVVVLINNCCCGASPCDPCRGGFDQ